MKINLDKCAECAAVGFVTLILIIATLLYVNNAFAEGKGDPHHEPVETYTVPTISLPDITINNYTQDNDKVYSLEKHVNALSALSSIPSLSSGTTGLGVGFGNSSGALVLEHRQGVMSYRLGAGHSQGEEVYQFGVMGSFR